MTNSTPPTKAERVSHLRWVPIAAMKVSPKAQQEFRQSHAEKFAADFNLEALGFPVVSLRGGHYFIVDGQHRVAALKLIGYGDQQIQCECYEGMTEESEAELFLQRNNRKEPPLYEKFRISITAGRDVECDIDRTVRANNLVISKDKLPGAVSAVGTLRRVYVRSGAEVLGRTLRILRDAYGDAGMEAALIDGVGMMCQRYNGDLPDEAEVSKTLGSMNGGKNGLLNLAEEQRRKTGAAKTFCVAGVAVDVINRSRGRGKKLPSWWQENQA